MRWLLVMCGGRAVGVVTSWNLILEALFSALVSRWLHGRPVRLPLRNRN